MQMPAADRTSPPIPARQASLRGHNLAVLLDQVLGAAGPISRATLAAATGLTRATVSALVDDLIRGDLLTEVAPSMSGSAGRPSIGLVLGPAGPVGVGLEVNVDYLAVCVVDLAGRVIHRSRAARDVSRRAAEPTKVLAALARRAARAVSAATAEGRTVVGAVMAVPGLVDARTVRVAPNLAWQDVTLPATVAGLPLSVDNEANLAALGEFAVSGAERDFLYVSGEIGIGAGIVIDGMLLRGTRGFAGEIGHMAVRPDGPRCGCGARGCLEQYAGQHAIIRAALPRGGTLADVVAATTGGKSRAVRAVDEAGRALGVALAGAVNLLDVSTVVLGGIFAPLAEWLAPAVRAELSDRVLAARWAEPSVRPSALGGDAAVRGAAYAALEPVRRNPVAWLPPR